LPGPQLPGHREVTASAAKAATSSDLTFIHVAPANRVGQGVEAIPDDAANPFDSRQDEHFCDLFRHCSGHAFLAK
jgi:hypothetical protein